MLASYVPYVLVTLLDIEGLREVGYVASFEFTARLWGGALNDLVIATRLIVYLYHRVMASQDLPVAGSSTPSKRWTQFYAALQLAIQSSAHKWTSVSSPLSMFSVPVVLRRLT